VAVLRAAVRGHTPFLGAPRTGLKRTLDVCTRGYEHGMDVCTSRSRQGCEPAVRTVSVAFPHRARRSAMSAIRTLLTALALTAFAAAAPAAAQSGSGGAAAPEPQTQPSGGASADFDVGTGGVDGGPDAAGEADDGVGIASRPGPDRTALARRVSAALREDARALPLALGDGVAAFVPASARSIAVFEPSSRPLGSPVLALACATGGCAVSVSPLLLVDGWGPTTSVALPRQSAALDAGRTFVVRLRLTRAQRAAVAASDRPRLQLRLTVLDSAGRRHVATRTVPVAAPLAA
jgi:hypothetical protein